MDGGTGSDQLSGGVGTDTYAFQSGDGKDTIADSDGNGSIIVGNTTLSGSTAAASTQTGKQIWKSGSGVSEVVYAFEPVGKTLAVSGALLGNDSQITIANFNLERAQNGTGYLGIKLDNTKKVALGGAGASNPLTQAGQTLTNLSANIAEGTGRGFKAFLNTAAKAGDVIKLAASDAADKLAVILGDSTVPFANGEVTLTLKEGQTKVSFSIVNSAELDANVTSTLTASYVSPGTGEGTTTTVASGNTATLSLVDGGETTRTYNGSSSFCMELDFTPNAPHGGHRAAWRARRVRMAGV